MSRHSKTIRVLILSVFIIPIIIFLNCRPRVILESSVSTDAVYVVPIHAPHFSNNHDRAVRRTFAQQRPFECDEFSSEIENFSFYPSEGRLPLPNATKCSQPNSFVLIAHER